MAAEIVTKVIEALTEAGIPAEAAYPGAALPRITEPRTAVSLEKLEYTARSATVLVTVMAPASQGGSVCEETGVRVGKVLEDLGGVCTQEACKFHGYADAYYVRVLGKFTGEDVMEEWAANAGFTVKLGDTQIPNAVAFKAEQAVDNVTGTPLSTAVWTFRLEEEYGRGESPPAPPAEPFTLTLTRSSGVEQYTECTMISIELADTQTGLRQVRTGVAMSRGFINIA